MSRTRLVQYTEYRTYKMTSHTDTRRLHFIMIMPRQALFQRFEATLPPELKNLSLISLPCLGIFQYNSFLTQTKFKYIYTQNPTSMKLPNHNKFEKEKYKLMIYELFFYKLLKCISQQTIISHGLHHFLQSSTDPMILYNFLFASNNSSEKQHELN